jgi:hypothetical protein
MKEAALAVSYQGIIFLVPEKLSRLIVQEILRAIRRADEAEGSVIRKMQSNSR